MYKKKCFLEILGDAGATTLLIDRKVPEEDYYRAVRESGSALDAIADGKFGYDEVYEKFLRKYGRTFKGKRTSESSAGTTSEFVRTRKNAWYYDAIDESLRRQAEFEQSNSACEEPKSFKEKVKKAEFVEAEVIDL